jgi:hypothetical protein
MIMPFGKFFGQTIQQVGDSDEGLLHLDIIVDQVGGELKEEIQKYLTKNKHRLDAAIESKTPRDNRTPDPKPRPWWIK